MNIGINTLPISSIFSDICHELSFQCCELHKRKTYNEYLFSVVYDWILFIAMDECNSNKR